MSSRDTTRWRDALAPWRRTIAAYPYLTPSTIIDIGPAREDLAALTIELSMDHVGCDRGRWLVLLEALELFHLLFYLDAQLCWEMLLEVCGKSIDRLAFPLAWLDEITPSYVLRIGEHDLLEAFDHVTEIFDVMVMGIAEWHHSPPFRAVQDKLLAALEAHDARRACIPVTCEFVFLYGSPDKVDTRVECLDAIKSLASFLRAYQEPTTPRYWDDSPFAVPSFAFDFGDSSLLKNELARVVYTMREFSVSSLVFSAWIRFGGLKVLKLYATDLAVIDRIMLMQAVGESDFLQSVTFVDRAHDAPPVDGWLDLMLDTLFGDNTESRVASVQLELSCTTLEAIVSAQNFLHEKYAGARRGGTANAHDILRRLVQLLTMQHDTVSLHDLMAVDPRGGVAAFSVAMNESGSAILPNPAPHRLSLHPVRSLTIGLNSDEEGGSTPAEAVALVWLVGKPLQRVTILGRTVGDGVTSLFSAKQLEQLLTACPNVERLELQGLGIESLEPLTDPSLCGHLRSLVIDGCAVLDERSVLDFYAALGDQAHKLHNSLQDLSMCEAADNDIESFTAALDMLADNRRLERFVLRSHPEGVALKLAHCVRVFHDEPLPGLGGQPIADKTKAAFLSVLASTLCFDPITQATESCETKKQVVQDVATRVFAFVAEPRRRYCVVVPS